MPHGLVDRHQRLKRLRSPSLGWKCKQSVENKGCGHNHGLLSGFDIGIFRAVLSPPLNISLQFFSPIFFINCVHGGKRLVQKVGK